MVNSELYWGEAINFTLHSLAVFILFLLIFLIVRRRKLTQSQTLASTEEPEAIPIPVEKKLAEPPARTPRGDVLAMFAAGALLVGGVIFIMSASEEDVARQAVTLDGREVVSINGVPVVDSKQLERAMANLLQATQNDPKARPKITVTVKGADNKLITKEVELPVGMVPPPPPSAPVEK